MLCRLAAIGGAAFRRPTIGSVLGRGVVAPVFLCAASAALPVVSNLEQTSALTDLEKYLLLPQEPMNINVLEWWKLHDHDKCADPATGRPEGLPHLAHMAREYLGEPATSAGVERLFSKAGRMHHDLKGSMEDGSLEHSLIATANTD